MGVNDLVRWGDDWLRDGALLLLRWSSWGRIEGSWRGEID
jgi:hypothetical protein